MFLLLVDVSSTFRETDREEHVCNVWYMIKKGNGKATGHYQSSNSYYPLKKTKGL